MNSCHLHTSGRTTLNCPLGHQIWSKCLSPFSCFSFMCSGTDTGTNSLSLPSKRPLSECYHDTRL